MYNIFVGFISVIQEENIMNKFHIAKCVDIKENDYEGSCIVLCCSSDPDFILFFPISKENSKLINYVLQDNKYDINTNILGIYKTMIDTWHSSDRYLSGIIMDTVYSEESKDEILMIRLALSNSEGDIDSLVYVNFLHAIMLAAMEDSEIIVSDKLIDKMLPSQQITSEESIDNKTKSKKSTTHFPEDKKIVDIAKKIMNGKIKDS